MTKITYFAVIFKFVFSLFFICVMVQIMKFHMCSNCVSCENKQTVFRTRDANSSINIMKLTSCWIDSQTRPTAFHSHISSFTWFHYQRRTGKSKTIVGEIPTIDFMPFCIFLP